MNILKKITSKIKISKRSVIIILSTFGILTLSASAFYAYDQYYPRKITLGVITDIHAGDQKYRDDGDSPDNILFPINYEKNVLSAIENLKDADLIITLGDNMNKGGRKHARKLKELTQNYPMLWTKGNHDKENEFVEILSEKTYYSFDKGSWRIIILDNSNVYPNPTSATEEHGRGYIDEAQMNWLKEALKTKKNIIIAMHVPMLRRGNLNEIRPDYKELEKLFIESGNVKHIFSGHFHTIDQNKEISGIEYHIVPSLSLKDHEGQFKKIIIEP